MTYLKRLEAELIIDWQILQQETDLRLKAIALKAYNIKYKVFKKNQLWNLELHEAVQ